MSGPRPKQRVLVRWNDDLDKSLLLFITYTCTEMGIRIPYDEVARRMGSTFSEGAIVQHISKLRTKMAELNVVPVPPPSKRGAVTTRPSGIYSQKPARAGPVPTSSQVSAPKSRSHEKKTAIKRGSRKIKRSESDDGTEDEEDVYASSETEANQVNANGKRRRTNKKSSQAAVGHKPSTSYDDSPEARKIRDTLNAGDEQFEQEQQELDHNYVNEVHGVLQHSIERSFRPFIGGVTDDIPEEELYEPVEPDAYPLARLNADMPNVYHQDKDPMLDVPLSPKSQVPLFESYRTAALNMNDFVDCRTVDMPNLPISVASNDLDGFDFDQAGMFGLPHMTPHLRPDNMVFHGLNSFDDGRNHSTISSLETPGMHTTSAYPATGAETPTTGNSFSTNASSVRPSMSEHLDSFAISINLDGHSANHAPPQHLFLSAEMPLFEEPKDFASTPLDFSNLMANVMT